MKPITCTINSITPFNEAVYRVTLTSTQPYRFKAGQYLHIVLNENDKRPFSIGCAPGSDTIELHIGAAVSESYPMQVVQHLQHCLAAGEPIAIEMAAGNAYLREDSQRPRILIAGGTGFSYIKSIVEQQIQLKQTIPTQLYWGCRTPSAMYDEALARQWQQQYPWLEFIAIAETADLNWQGNIANLLDQIKQDYSDLNNYDIYIAGRFEMAAAARELFRELNVNEQHLYGDAFSFLD